MLPGQKLEFGWLFGHSDSAKLLVGQICGQILYLYTLISRNLQVRRTDLDIFHL